VTPASVATGSTALAALDRGSFAEVASPEHRRAVYSLLCQLSRDPAAAEDLTQDTFVRALRAWPRYDPARGTVRVWLLTMARSVWIDHSRSERSRRRREAAYGAEDRGHAEPPSVGGVSGALRAAVGRLSEAEREVLALRVVLELSGAETATVLGISESSCSSMLHRAITKLRKEVPVDG